MTEVRNRGGRIALRGVPREELEGLRSQLVDRGVEVVNGLQQADLVVVGQEARDWMKTSATRRGLQVVSVEDFLAGLELTAPVATVPVEALPERVPVEVREREVRILDVVLPRNPVPGPLTPPAEQFRHFCLDGPTLRTARSVALAAAHGIPCLLEGETATAKTSVILWVASLANAEVVRLNLNGQTDTSELVGRYVPSEGAADVDEEALHAHRDLLEDESRRILQRARSEHRRLTVVERQQVAANERLPVPPWRFHEGWVPRAMRRGHWVVLDEVNLAEPQVLERLNPVVEQPPSLVLTEGSGTVYGPGGDVPVHAGFRMFATMNPAEYAGRNALSPAWRDRWQVSRFVEAPTEADLLAMLRRLVFGEQPEVATEGVVWRAPASAAVYPGLAEVPDMEGLLERLAIFHASVTAAAGGGGGPAALGRTRRERYVFTRRTLLTVMALMARHAIVTPDGRRVDLAIAPERIVRDVLERLYLDRLQDGADREALVSALRAAGLGEP